MTVAAFSSSFLDALSRSTLCCYPLCNTSSWAVRFYMEEKKCEIRREKCEISKCEIRREKCEISKWEIRREKFKNSKFAVCNWNGPNGPPYFSELASHESHYTSLFMTRGFLVAKLWTAVTICSGSKFQTFHRVWYKWIHECVCASKWLIYQKSLSVLWLTLDLGVMMWDGK